MLHDNKKQGRERRGEISENDLQPYLNCSQNQLILLLNDSEAKKRTIAATILGENYSDKITIEQLCSSFKKEKAIYSRIAISEALSNIGEGAVPYLIDLLGEIGTNQEKSLPIKYFNKKSYPLSRDLAARTLVKIGKPATPYLIDIIGDGEDFVLQQALDAVGGIASKTSDQRALNSISKKFYGEYINELTLWKISRCLSGFKGSEKASQILVDIIKTNPDDPIIWESIRSLGQIGVSSIEIIEIIKSLENNENGEIQKAVRIALNVVDTNI